MLYDLDGIRDRKLWEGLQAIGVCVRERTANGTTSEETHSFIGSVSSRAATYAASLGNPWGIENRLHWQLGVSFREGANRVHVLPQSKQEFAFARVSGNTLPEVLP